VHADRSNVQNGRPRLNVALCRAKWTWKKKPVAQHGEIVLTQARLLFDDSNIDTVRRQSSSVSSSTRLLATEAMGHYRVGPVMYVCAYVVY